MSNYVTSAAYAASQFLAAQGLAVKRSHLSEVLAALLGYRTLAALNVEQADPAHDYHLDDAEFLVLNPEMGTTRLEELGIAPSDAIASSIAKACIAALKASAAPVPVFEGVADFYDSHARQALAEAIYDDENVAGAMAESNASYPDLPEMNEACPETSNLWAAGSDWTIEADGTMEGEYDPEGDRMFNGDT